MTQYSLVIPVYRNAENMPSLFEALEKLSKRIDGTFEVVFVVDGSPDDSGQLLLEGTPTLPFSTTIAFHSRNFGAFTAIRTGLEYAKGDYVAVMAADLQEPPELVCEFFDILSKDKADVIFGKREGRKDKLLTRLASDLFWWIYRRYVLKDMPKGGVDIFGCNRKVLDAVLSIEEPNSSLIAQLFWVGFRRSFVGYVRRARVHGKSSWSFSKRFRYMMDSIFSFSDLPILLVLWIGIIGCTVSVILGGATLYAKLAGYIHEAGYASLFLLVMFFGSLTLAVQGIIGSYIWRALENTKRRPLRLISHVVYSAVTNEDTQ